MVHSFNHSILLWGTFNGELTNNTFILTNFQKWIGLILTTIIKFESFYLITYLSFNHFLPLQKYIKNLILMPHSVNPNPAGVIINKGNIIMLTSKKNNLSKPPHIYVYIVKCTICLMNCSVKLDYNLLP